MRRTSRGLRGDFFREEASGFTHLRSENRRTSSSCERGAQARHDEDLSIAVRSHTLLRDDLGRGLTDDEAQAEAGTHDSVGLGEVILVEGSNV